MIIGATNISTFQARQHKVSYSYPERDSSSEWFPGAANPTFYHNYQGMETMTLEVIVKGSSRPAIRENIRQILSLFDFVPSVIQLNDGSYFSGTLQTFSVSESSRDRWHKLTLSVRGMAFRVIRSAELSFELPGTRSLTGIFPLGSCQAVLSFKASALTDATISIQGIAYDRKSNPVAISFDLTDIPADGWKTVYIGELPPGIHTSQTRENPTLISLSDGTPIPGLVGAVPRLRHGDQSITVSASDISTGGASITVSGLVVFLSGTS